MVQSSPAYELEERSQSKDMFGELTQSPDARSPPPRLGGGRREPLEQSLEEDLPSPIIVPEEPDDQRVVAGLRKRNELLQQQMDHLLRPPTIQDTLANPIEIEPILKYSSKPSQDRNLLEYNLFLEEKKRKQSALQRREHLSFYDIGPFKYCQIHPQEEIKYYCREERLGICSECIVHHAKHDFIFADEAASEEIKGNSQALHFQIDSQHKSYSEVCRDVDNKFTEL